MTTAPTFFVLHDVTANTYSRELIVNSKLKNLHDLFKVRPRWFNRSRTICDNVMMIRFKNATPRTKYQMVPLSETNRKVRHAVNCLLRGGQLFGGGKKAKVAQTFIVSGSVVYKLLQKREQEALNDACLKDLKTKIGNESTNVGPTLHYGCEGILDGQKLKKGNFLSNGTFGKVYKVRDYFKKETKKLIEYDLVIKEQKALCYIFMNEIECLHALKDDDIAPKLVDAYVCIENKDSKDIKNSEVTYGFVIEKMDSTLWDFLFTYSPETTVINFDFIIDRIYHILTILDERNIQHRDLHLGNFMVKTKLNNNYKREIQKLMIIDFGQAAHNNKQANYMYPLLKKNTLNNKETFYHQNFSFSTMLTYKSLIYSSPVDNETKKKQSKRLSQLQDLFAEKMKENKNK